jgi:hypothetical protein
MVKRGGGRRSVKTIMETGGRGPTGAELALDALSVYRLTVLLQKDVLPPLPRLRQAVMDRWGAKPVSELVDCPWCLSVWLGLVAAVARRATPRLWALAAAVLASSAATGLLSVWRTSLEPKEVELLAEPDFESALGEYGIRPVEE